MIYSCRCGTVINVAPSHFCYISDNELERLCLYEGSITALSPWMESALDDQGQVEEKKYHTKAPDRGISLDDAGYEEDEDPDDEDQMDTNWDISDDYEQ